MRKIRTLQLDAITMPVIIEHAEMDIAEEGRIDKISSRVDTLAMDVRLRYKGDDLKKSTHAGVFNYMGLYDALCFSPVRKLRGPLESVLDETLALIEKQSAENKIELVSASVTAQRLGLVVGAPELQRRKVYTQDIQLPDGDYRSAGIGKVPLQVKVDHTWSKDAEHSAGKNLFPETVQLAFAAISPAAVLDAGSLAGLYNYIKTYKLASTFQDTVVDGPFEGLAEDILNNVMEDTRELNPAMLSVSIVRSGYARCRPTLGVELWL